MEMKEDSVVLIAELQQFLSFTLKGKYECLDVVWPAADEYTL